MPKFHVAITQSQMLVIEVSAENEHEAREQVMSGEFKDTDIIEREDGETEVRDVSAI